MPLGGYNRARANEGWSVTVSPTRRPHVGINAHLLSTQESYRQAGVSRYIHGLLAHLEEVDPGGQYTVFLNRGCTLYSSLRQRHARISTVNPWVRILWEQACLPWLIQAEKIDVLHSPVNIQPLVLPSKGVVTVTDLSFLLFPQSLGGARRRYQSLLTKASSQRATGLIAISHSTAHDLQKWFDVPVERITVVYPGVSTAYHPIKDRGLLEDFRRRGSLADKFILFVGTLEPRKNLVMLLRAYAEFRRRTGGSHKLVLAGGRGWLYQPILAEVEELGLRGEVLFPGFVPEPELPLWYNAADAFVYPSLYEGFGLPPLEAMACGTPVAVSRASSLPEVVGDAGLLLEPDDKSAWAEAMIQLCFDHNLRSELSARGPVRALEFSWTRAAKETAQVYERVCSGGG